MISITKSLVLKLSMKYFSMFSGIGGFELAIERQTDWECVGYSEIDKYADIIYKKHFNHKNYGDATKIDPKNLPDFSLLVGGFPCQAFSVAGKRRGFEDTRGTLFLDIARILKEKKPQYILLENVKGLLSHDSGRTFKTILRILADLGYRVQWQVLNSKDHGVPQNRERIFIIGNLGRKPRPQVLPIKRKAENTIKQVNNPKHSNDRVYSTKGTSPTLNTMQGGNRQPFIQAVLSASDSKTIRRLTPLECDRLQGFPDRWTKAVSDSRRYKALGNAVTVNVIEAIIQGLK